MLELGCEPVSTVRFQGGPSLTDPEPASTALHDAARFGQVDMIRFILDGGYQTDVQELDDRQLSPLWYAYAQNQCLFRPACRPPACWC